MGNDRWILKNLLHPRILDHGSPMFLYDGGDTRQLGIKIYIEIELTVKPCFNVYVADQQLKVEIINERQLP